MMSQSGYTEYCVSRLLFTIAPLAALVKQVWHLVAQTPLVRGAPPKTPNILSRSLSILLIFNFQFFNLHSLKKTS